MILIDSNALMVLLIGLIDPALIPKHKRTSIYEAQDFYDLLGIIGTLDKLVTLPNIWTEVDNLLNRFPGNLKHEYIVKLAETLQSSTEKFLKSLTAVQSDTFYALGLTDSLILELSKKCSLLITSDSALSDHAIARGIKVYDLVKNRNNRL